MTSSFVAQESSIYVVLGPNGAGKTTLFRTIAGILEPFTGKVTLDGESIASSKEVRKRINYLSHFNAIPGGDDGARRAGVLFQH